MAIRLRTVNGMRIALCAELMRWLAEQEGTGG